MLTNYIHFLDDEYSNLHTLVEETVDEEIYPYSYPSATQNIFCQMFPCKNHTLDQSF